MRKEIVISADRFPMTPDEVYELASLIKDFPKRHCPISHYFAPGVYVRQMVIPANTVAIGHNHLHEHLFTLVKGQLLVFPDGNSIDVMQAPHTFLAKPGNKIVYALEDCIVHNVHPNPDNIRDQDVIEKMFYDIPEKIKVVDERLQDRMDHDSIDYQPHPHRTYIDLPVGFETAINIRLSFIHGYGVHSTIPFEAVQYIAPYAIDGQYTRIAQYVNHAKDPNCVLVELSQKNIVLAALRQINGCMGDSQGEELTIDYRKGLP